MNGLVESNTIPEKNWLRMFWAPRVIPRVMTPALSRIPVRSTPNSARIAAAALTVMTILPIILNSGMRDESTEESVPLSALLRTTVMTNTKTVHAIRAPMAM